MSSLHEGTTGRRGEGRAWGRENKEDKGRVKPTNCSADSPSHKGGKGRGKLSSPRRQSYPAFAAPAQQECNLRVFSPSQLSLHKEEKSNTCKRWGERCRQEKISLPSNHVWGCVMALCVLFPGHSKAPTVLIIPIT